MRKVNNFEIYRKWNNSVDQSNKENINVEGGASFTWLDRQKAIKILTWSFGTKDKLEPHTREQYWVKVDDSSDDIMMAIM